MKYFLRLVILAAFVPMLVSGALAQSYPNKPISMIVPFPPGSIADVIGRLIGQKLGGGLGQQVIIENRPGAGSTIAADMVAKAAPDGYTIYLTDITTHAINASLYRKLAYDSIKDFAPVTLVTSTPLMLVVNPSLPATSVKELIALAKSKPGQLNIGSGGNGTITHLAGELFKTLAGVDILHVPYTGAPPAITAALGGEVSVLFTTTPAVLAHVKAGKLRALAVTSPKRSPIAPDVPTIAEAGVAGYEIVLWNGILVPARTPKDIITKLNSELVKVLKMPDVKEQFAAQGGEPSPSSPDQLASYMKVETEKMAKLVKASGARVE